MILNLRFIFWHSAKTLLIGGLLSTTFGLTQSPATASGIQKLADFSYADGRYPFSGLTWGGDGLFYGTTSSGGSFGLNGAGTIFSFNPANNALTKLADFDGFNGARSEASLTLGSDGLFYGTASGGGSLGGDFGRGTIFSFDPTSNALTKLAEFDDSNGALPSASLTLSPDGLFYGTTSGGGSFGSGTIFSFNPTSNTLSKLADFDGVNGSFPEPSLTLGVDELLYGTTPFGGSFDSGTIFSFDPTNNTLTSLASFDGANGFQPFASLTLSPDGLFYGTTSGGGSFGSGTIFSFDPTNNVLTNLASFDGANGASPVASLTLDFNGVFYGTTYTGNNIDGTIFSFNPAKRMSEKSEFKLTVEQEDE